MGLERAGFEPLALIEIDKDAADTLKLNRPDWNVIQTDVRLINYKPFEEKIQLLAGGPPCQPFSLGGKHMADNDKRDMFPEAVRAVRELKPRAFIFENVQGILRKNFRTYFDYILLQLQYPEIVQVDESYQEHFARLEKYKTEGHSDGLTYRTLFKIVNVADYGIPQIRRRVIIVGFRNDFNVNWSFPLPTHSEEVLKYSKWISKSYWAEHGLTVPKDFSLKRDEIRKLCRNVEENLFPLHVGEPFAMLLKISLIKIFSIKSHVMEPRFIRGIQAVHWIYRRRQ